jgi:4-methyl-5(b-hydroxyethyl)-thiazole monophosphate biosynthesis
MSKIGVLMANGCEEIEALTVVDIVRRGGVDVTTIAISGSRLVTGSHNISFFADTIKQAVNFDELEGIILPGGMPGTINLGVDEIVVRTIRDFARDKKMVAAICAAPSILGKEHILEGKKATCHPGFEDKLLGAEVLTDSVVCDGNIITSRGMGTAIDFGLYILGYFTDDATVDKVRKSLVYNK